MVLIVANLPRFTVYVTRKSCYAVPTLIVSSSRALVGGLGCVLIGSNLSIWVALPGSPLEALKGGRAGHFSIRSMAHPAIGRRKSSIVIERL